MVKIIEYGTLQKTRCNNCGCLFSYECEDVNVEKEADIIQNNRFADPMMERKFVKCPQCNEKIYLEVTK